MDIFNPYYLQIVMFMIINAIMGISIYITLPSGQLSLGAAGFMSVGAYVAALITLKADLPIAVGILVSLQGVREAIIKLFDNVKDVLGTASTGGKT